LERRFPIDGTILQGILQGHRTLDDQDRDVIEETTRLATSVDTFLRHLENAQWWPPDIMRRHQFQLLEALVAHAYQTVPWYRRRFDALGLAANRIAAVDAWPAVPILTRTDIQDAGQALHSTATPSSHGRISPKWTSGSTATPVMVLTTELTARIWIANSVREHRWRACDFRGKLAVIRNMPGGDAEPPHGLPLDSWGLAVETTGPCVVLSSRSTASEQAAWLLREQPNYLHSYPPLVYELARHFIASDLRMPSLLGVYTHGGVVEPRVREACRQACGRSRSTPS
jgi:phenylacetate-CoA ligase